MSRAERLLDLLKLLRRHRAPVTGPALAAELGISLRTLYRDIATLQAQGAEIRGEAGLGYVLMPGFTLPPLMFTADEIEALVLGTRWVAARAADERLGLAASDALNKIAAVLPPALRESVDSASLLVGGGETIAVVADLAAFRTAIRAERKVTIGYRDNDGGETSRTIWPFAIGFFDKVRVIVSWCELRQDFRSFRADRVLRHETLTHRYPRRRAALLKEWRARNNIPNTR